MFFKLRAHWQRVCGQVYLLSAVAGLLSRPQASCDRHKLGHNGQQDPEGTQSGKKRGEAPLPDLCGVKKNLSPFLTASFCGSTVHQNAFWSPLRSLLRCALNLISSTWLSL